VAVLGLLLLPSFPSCASLSRKSLHSSANESLLVGVEALLSNCVLRDCVEGVRRKGEEGRRSVDDIELEEGAPGRARPACSFCSINKISILL